MTSVARFEEGCECEAKMASRQPAGRRRYTGATPALGELLALHGCYVGVRATTFEC